MYNVKPVPITAASAPTMALEQCATLTSAKQATLWVWMDRARAAAPAVLCVHGTTMWTTTPILSLSPSFVPAAKVAMFKTLLHWIALCAPQTATIAIWMLLECPNATEWVVVPATMIMLAHAQLVMPAV